MLQFYVSSQSWKLFPALKGDVRSVQQEGISLSATRCRPPARFGSFDNENNRIFFTQSSWASSCFSSSKFARRSAEDASGSGAACCSRAHRLTRGNGDARIYWPLGSSLQARLPRFSRACSGRGAGRRGLGTCGQSLAVCSLPFVLWGQAGLRRALECRVVMNKSLLIVQLIHWWLGRVAAGLRAARDEAGG